MIGSGHYHLSPLSKLGGTNALLQSNQFTCTLPKIHFSAASNNFLHLECSSMSTSPLIKIRPILENLSHMCVTCEAVLVHSGLRALLSFSTCRSMYSSHQSAGVCHTALFWGWEQVSPYWMISPQDHSLRMLLILCRVRAAGQFRSTNIYCALWCYLRTSCYGEKEVCLLFKATFIWVCTSL